MCTDKEENKIFLIYNEIQSGAVANKAVNQEDKLSPRYRGRDLAKFERSRRYRER
jgi:hypothetical protein